MHKGSFALEIKGIQAQLDTLRSLVSLPKKSKSFADLYGIWKGKVNLSLEEIKEAEFRLPKNLLE